MSNHLKLCLKGLHYYTPGKGCIKCKNFRNKKWQTENLENHRKSSEKWRLNNLDKHTVANSNWQKNNRGKAAAKTRRYQAKKIQATPKWLSEEQSKQIEKFYLQCPKGMHVDHIIPLRGKQVCGLHVPWNLQIIDAKTNQSKGSKI